MLFATGFQIFVQIHMFLNVIKEMEPKPRFISSLRHYKEYAILNILYILYLVHSMHFCSIKFTVNAYKSGVYS